MATPKSEDGLIAWIKERCARGGDDLLIGIGDDMAMVRTDTSSQLLVTSDMLMDGVHFDTTTQPLIQIGRKTLAVSLSDCAAMAVRPRWFMASVALPQHWAMSQAKELFEGMSKLGAEFDCKLIGGDTNSWDKPLVIDVTVLAEPWKVEGKPDLAPVRRDGMRVNDLVIVTGELGGSLASHHLSFTPRVHEGRSLRFSLGNAMHAMMDISDGLSTDAARMARMSGCGISFKPNALMAVSSDAAKEMSTRDGHSVLDHVLNDGEDFELLFTVDPDAWLVLEKSGRDTGRKSLPLHCRVIGTAIEGEGLWLDEAGGRSRIESRGWQHFHD